MLLQGARSIASWLQELKPLLRYLVLALAGALSTLAFAPFFLWPMLFLTFPIFLLALDNVAALPDEKRLRVSAATGWWFGFGFFASGLFWIGEAFLVEADKFAWLLPFAVTLMPAGLALFWAAAAAAAVKVSRPGLSRFIMFAAALSAAEWLRGHILTGFPWNLPGYALTSTPTWMQSASLIGVYGLTLVALLIFAAPAVLAMRSDRGMQTARIALVLSGAALVILYAFGLWRLAYLPSETVPGVTLRIVQPSVAQREKWQAAKQREIFERHISMSLRNPSGEVDQLAGISHVIWPEAAMPFLPLEHPEALDALATLIPDNVRLIAGALRLDQTSTTKTPTERRGFNSLMVFESNGRPSTIYDKVHLVPFGEYLPLRPFLSMLGIEKLAKGHGSFVAGPEPRPLLDVAGLPKVGPLICYEALFPNDASSFVARPGVLINLTNDGWFGATTGPYQHFHQARVRAVEQGLPLIRAANNGISAVVAPDGHVLTLLDLDVRGVIDSPLPAALSPTPYSSYGDWSYVVLLILTVSLGLAVQKRQRPD